MRDQTRITCVALAAWFACSLHAAPQAPSRPGSKPVERQLPQKQLPQQPSTRNKKQKKDKSSNRLRNAGPTVFGFYPEADSFRVIVRDVDHSARAVIEKKLPFKVHFNELGPHALYLATRKRAPIGFVYLRSEQGQWGFTDIAWSISMDLRVLGFRFLNGRSRYRLGLERSAFARRLVGKRGPEVARLLTTPHSADEPAEVKQLANTVMRSAVKTLLVLDVVWGHEVTKLQDLAMGYEAFPGAVRFRRQAAELSIKDGDTTLLRSVRAMRARGKGRLELGTVVRTESGYDDSSLSSVVIKWVLAKDERVLEIKPLGSPSKALLESCSDLIGYRLGHTPKNRSTLAQIGNELRSVLLRLESRR